MTIMNTGAMWGWIGGVAGSVIGLAGGIAGTYFCITHTNGPRERSFMIGIFQIAGGGGVIHLRHPPAQQRHAKIGRRQDSEMAGPGYRSSGIGFNERLRAAR